MTLYDIKLSMHANIRVNVTFHYTFIFNRTVPNHGCLCWRAYGTEARLEKIKGLIFKDSETFFSHFNLVITEPFSQPAFFFLGGGGN